MVFHNVGPASWKSQTFIPRFLLARDKHWGDESLSFRGLLAVQGCPSEVGWRNVGSGGPLLIIGIQTVKETLRIV